MNNLSLYGLVNDGGSGIATVWPVLSSRIGRLHPFINSGEKRGNMRKQYKETDYSKKLRDPRWQKKRLEIMQRDEFTCQSCFDSESTLNVHHTYYTKGNEPWDYPTGSLVTLCEYCHQEETEDRYAHKEFLIQSLCENGLLARHFYEIADAFQNFACSERGCPDPFISALAYIIKTKEGRTAVEEIYYSHIRGKING